MKSTNSDKNSSIISARVASAQTVSLLYHLSTNTSKDVKGKGIVYYHSLQPDKKGDQFRKLRENNTFLREVLDTETKVSDQITENVHTQSLENAIESIKGLNLEDQSILDKKILFGGAGIGSVIAEVVVRMGFRKLVLLDTDEADLSNLNRQNYTINDLGKPKVEQLKARLKKINKDVDIEIHHVFLDEQNVHEYVDDDVAIAVNALDYDNGAPFIFDEACLEKNIKIVHPGNFSWGAQAFVVSGKRSKLDSVIQGVNLNSVVNFLHTEIKKQYPYINLDWFTEIPSKLIENPHLPSPQMSVGAGLVAAQTTKIIIDILNGSEDIKPLPEVYFLNANFNSNKS